MVAWLEDAIFYEIYPQSFYDTNADGIGDLNGVIEKLDYILSLGCNAIWLNPCFVSPFMDAGYDVADYCCVAPRYGTNADMKRLFEEALRRGMHVLLDLVPGHTSQEHPWFIESMKAQKNEYTDRYVWTNSVWESTEGIPCLRGISDRDGSVAVNFFTTQPALNYGYANPDADYQMRPDDAGPLRTREAMKDVMRFWLSMGCDGFRVDMAGSLVKNDPDGAATIKLWQDFRAFLDEEFPNAVMVSEWGEPEKSIAGGFHMDFLLHFGPPCYTSLFRGQTPFFSRKGEGDITVFSEHYLDLYERSKGKGLICIPSGNHDMDRLARLRDPEELKICFVFLLTMPGAPFLYYGDEIGMRYLEGLTSKEGGYSRTGSRTPMQWDNGPNAGFSVAPPEKLYLPIDASDDRPTVAAQENNPASLLSLVRSLTALRRAHGALHNFSDFSFVYAEKDAYPLVYRRSDEKETIIVALNPAGRKETCPAALPRGAKLLLSVGQAPEAGGDGLTMQPCSAAIWSVEKDV